MKKKEKKLLNLANNQSIDQLKLDINLILIFIIL